MQVPIPEIIGGLELLFTHSHIREKENQKVKVKEREWHEGKQVYLYLLTNYLANQQLKQLKMTPGVRVNLSLWSITLAQRNDRGLVILVRSTIISRTCSIDHTSD